MASYDAGEDNELSFKEGDQITDIEKVDPDWWQGRCNGQEGLFPGEHPALCDPSAIECLLGHIIVAAYVVSPDEYPPQD